MRIRRHFIEPATVRLTLEGRVVHTFSIQADTKIPYRIETVPLPPLVGSASLALGLQTTSENPRPLGVALDWLEIEAPGPGHILPQAGMRWRSLTVVLAALIVPWLLAARRLATLHALLMAGAIAWGTALHPVAAERILREGAWVYVVVALATLAGLGLAPARSGATGVGAGLATVVMAGLAVRLALLLHPQFFYPDVRVHAVFARAFARQGFADFMSAFTTNQFRYSLGLQFENGHWYAFPYPPGFYLVAGPLVRWLALAPEVAVSVVAAALNAASALVVYGIARRLGLAAGTALAAAAAVPLLPLFTTRLTLAYFPAMAGQLVDALAILYLLSRLRHLDRPRVALALACLVALALLTYTQSLVNLGLLLPAFLMLQFACQRAAWRRHAGLALAGALGALLAFGLFYARYVPVFLDMRRGVPMEGETIVLERIAQQERARLAADEEAESGVDDPYAGPAFDALRGLRKATWRLWIFYGPFAAAVAFGFLLLSRRSEKEAARFVVAWGAVYVALNFGSASLPGPNLLRYNKDLEIVAPLFCICLAVTGEWLARFTRAGCALFAASYVGWGVARTLAALDARTLIEGR